MFQFLSLPIYTFHQGQFIGAPCIWIYTALELYVGENIWIG